MISGSSRSSRGHCYYLVHNLWLDFPRRLEHPADYGGDVTHGGDTIEVLANAQAFLNGEIAPVVQKFVKSLGAPFAANWNDYPITEELIFAAMGWLGRGIGLFASANVILLLAHVLAGLSFYWVAKTLSTEQLSALPGVLFAFSPIIFLLEPASHHSRLLLACPPVSPGDLVDLLGPDNFMGPKMVDCGRRLLYYRYI